jgi:hypothetical protein
VAPPPSSKPETRPAQKITMAEIAAVCDRANLPPILDLGEAAKLIKLKASTLRRKVSEGAFKGCVARGKPLRFWRDRLVYQVMNAGD